MAQYFVGIPLTYFGMRGECLLVLHHWAFQKFRWQLNQCFPSASTILRRYGESRERMAGALFLYVGADAIGLVISD